MPRSQESVRRALGAKAEEAERLLATGITGAAVAKRLGLDPRLVSFLRADPAGPAGDASGGPGEAPEATPGEAVDPGGLGEYRRQLLKAIPVSKRVALVKRAIQVGLKANNPLLLGQALRAVERADEVGGLTNRKGEGQNQRSVPIFGLPSCACQVPRLHVAKGDGRGVLTPLDSSGTMEPGGGGLGGGDA